MKQSIVEMNKVIVARGSRRVLQVDRLAVRSGEFVAVVGPNGAGKSTLLQVLNLLLPYQEGNLSLFGLDAKQEEPLSLRRRCAMVFQNPLLLKDTVFNNVALALTFRKLPAAAIETRVLEALTAFRCQHLAYRAAQYLSGGEIQRVCLARAMVHQPELLLLDEPFAALDAPTRAALLAEFRTVAERAGMTVVIVSHHFQDVLGVAGRVIALEAGRVVQDDVPETMLRRPVTRTVAELTGMDNIFPCTLEAVGESFWIQLSRTIQFQYAGCFSKNTPSYCCLPGDIFTIRQKQADGGPPSDQPTFEGVVQHIAPGIGIYRVSVAVDGIILHTCLPREQVVECLKPGMPVQLQFDSCQIHLI